VLTSAAASNWYEQGMRLKYVNPSKLISYLDENYGRGNYHVKTRLDRYILFLPEPLSQLDLAEMEHQVGFHYRNRKS
jgi:chemotaxis methyl-accepting protein methylase